MSFNIPSFPDLPALPALPSLPSVLPAGLPSGSFSDMINAAATHIGMNDAVQQAQAQIQSVAQLQSFGVPMPPNVMNLAHSELESVTNFSPTSMFKNPAEDELAHITSMASAVTSGLNSALSAVPAEAVDGIKQIAESVTSMTRFPAQAKADICTRIASLSTDVPVLVTARNLQNQAMVTNAAVTGAAPSDVKSTLLDNSFPSGNTQCSGLNLDTAFKPVTQAATHFSDSMMQMFGAVKDDATGLFKVGGTVVTDVASFLSSGVSSMVSNITSMISSAVTSLASAATEAIGGLLAGLSSQLNSVKDMFTPMISGFKQMVQDAKDTIKHAVNLVKSLSLINLLTNTDPCVKGVVSAVVQPSKVDANAVSELTKPKSQKLDSPIQTGIDRAKVNAPIPDIPVQTRPEPVPPADVPNPYTKEELAAFKPMIDAVKDQADELRKQAAAKDTETAEWRKSVNYDQKRDAANLDTKLSRRDPGFGVGRSPDPTVNATWKEVFDQHVAKVAEHNAIRDQVATKDQLHSRMEDEYELRARYGKTPYTTMEAVGVPAFELRPEWAKFTFLDSGK